MALVKCKECKKDVSNKAEVCPHCGVKKPGMNMLVGAAVLVVMVAIGWVYIQFSGDDDTINQEMLGSYWPFTVSSGSVDCVNGAGAVFESAGVTYQLNGPAKTLGYAAIDPIWKDNPDIPGTKVSLATVIEMALDACK